ncbi:hypothetical protein PR048_033584 [Dryococelus australis]|uniref:Uncharacterized protein n=1 Tax=Dryococelus australis TaxID=614101 RepID=A0ABQ9G0Q6_9NEOP|nr:hypothetical protein PR048_033584 [Dryococelus australis]
MKSNTTPSRLDHQVQNYPQEDSRKNEDKTTSSKNKVLMLVNRLQSQRLENLDLAIRDLAQYNGNLMQLLEERNEDVPFLENWLAKRDKWLSGDIQNEIIEILEHMLQRELLEDVKKSIDYGLLAGGTADVSGQEQLNSRADNLFSVIIDFLTHMNLSNNNLRGVCFDGAANMSGNEALLSLESVLLNAAKEQRISDEELDQHIDMCTQKFEEAVFQHFEDQTSMSTRAVAHTPLVYTTWIPSSSPETAMEENPHGLRIRGHQHRFAVNVWAGIIDYHLIVLYLLHKRLTISPQVLLELLEELQLLIVVGCSPASLTPPNACFPTRRPPPGGQAEMAIPREMFEA